jgi:hypothetical protein
VRNDESEIAIADRGICSSYAENAITTRLVVVASILRLGTKYGVAYFRQIAVARLLQAIPTTLDQYLELQKGPATVFEGQGHMDTMLVVLHLARECNLPALLPCCLWFWTAISGELSREYRPGTVGSSFTTEDGRLYALDVDTYSLCLSAGWQLDERRRKTITATLMTCGHDDHSCFEDATQLLEDLLRDRDINVLQMLGMTWWGSEFDLCDACAEKAAELWDMGRRATWKVLPSFYELAPWEELLAGSQPTSES